MVFQAIASDEGHWVRNIFYLFAANQEQAEERIKEHINEYCPDIPMAELVVRPVPELPQMPVFAHNKLIMEDLMGK